MIVNLTEFEYSLCTQMAVIRDASNRNSGVQDQMIDKKQGKFAIELQGLMGELAFAKWAKLYPNLDVKPQSKTTDVVYKGWKCDIKVTKHLEGRLIVSLTKTKASSDVYILGIISGLSVDFVGYCLAEQVMQEANIKDLGQGPCYCLDKDDLTKFDEGKS
jgi:hypothetical protein